LGKQAAAIAVLHGAGIIHGDLSPQNIFFNEDGRLVVTNFGASTIHQSTMLRPVQLVPPSEYQAPEVHLGWTQHFAVDCWGFGILLYMMLFGSVRNFTLAQAQ
jgi:serine/threonine protein kinase